MGKTVLKIEIDCAFDEMADIANLKPNPANPNRHTKQQIELLAAIIKATKWRYPITVSRQSGMIVTGHCRYEAALHLGLDSVPVNYQSFESYADELAELARENRIREYAEVDGLMMADLLCELDQANYDLNLVAMTPEEIQDYIIGPVESKPEDDIVPEPPKKAITKTGDLWILGQHRLLCGDCTISANVARLMGQEKADTVFTDPPYGMNLNTDFSGMKGIGRGKKYQAIKGDNNTYNPEFIFKEFNYCKEIFLWGADYYAELIKNRNAGCFFVWDKTESGISPNSAYEKQFGSNFELCWSKTKHKRQIIPCLWKGIFGLSSEDTKLRVHPAQKPVKLCVWFIEKFSEITNIIVDVYLGSGSTLIACEKLNRRCYGIEIDPIYCDVIIERWEKFTGKKAEREKKVA